LNLPGLSDQITELAKFAKSNTRISEGKFDECWVVVGSGVLAEALINADIANKYICVCVHGVIPDSVKAHQCLLIKEDVLQPAKTSPPFQSAVYHESKAWEMLWATAKQNPTKSYIFWNSY